jgi:hypothetical protein
LLLSNKGLSTAYLFRSRKGLEGRARAKAAYVADTGDEGEVNMTPGSKSFLSGFLGCLPHRDVLTSVTARIHLPLIHIPDYPVAMNLRVAPHNALAAVTHWCDKRHHGRKKKKNILYSALKE